MDTTTCPDAYRAYRQWDDEAAREIYLERLRESILGRILSPEGHANFAQIMSDVDDPGIDRAVTDLMHCAIVAFYGGPTDRMGHRQLITTHADRLAQRLYKVVKEHAQKDAEITLKKMMEGDY